METPQTRRICTQFRSVAKVTAVQAVCLDDKAIPHPASQVMPDRDVLPSYEGEVFRCIAGARMQYTLADYAGIRRLRARPDDLLPEGRGALPFRGRPARLPPRSARRATATSVRCCAATAPASWC